MRDRGPPSFLLPPYVNCEFPRDTQEFPGLKRQSENGVFGDPAPTTPFFGKEITCSPPRLVCFL